MPIVVYKRKTAGQQALVRGDGWVGTLTRKQKKFRVVVGEAEANKLSGVERMRTAGH